MLTETEKAYLAGFLDADGMIRLKIGMKNERGPKSLIPLVHYTNTCMMTIKRVMEMLGKSQTNFKANVQRRKNGSGWTDKVEIEIAGLKRVVPFLTALRPYLITKALEGDLLLRFAELRNKGYNLPYGTEEFRIFEALKYLKKTRHLRDYTPSADDVLCEDIVRTNAEALEVAEMSARLPIEARKEWARNLVSTYRWHRSPK